MLAGRVRTPTVRDVGVDESGVVATSRREVILDVSFDGRRVWSFWLHRDGESLGGGRHRVPWPRTLTMFLDGTARLTVRVHQDDGAPLFDREVRLGSGEGRIAVETSDGRPIALDKYNRRVVPFDQGAQADVEPLMQAIDEVLGVLADSGVTAFLAYGTLLGAVRDGHLIGHDSDADVGYVSRHEHPADVARESFRLQRALVERGHEVVRYSTAAFMVHVRRADGSVRGLDVFGGFLREGRLHLMGEIRTPFKREWIEPLGSATLEGHRFPVPADTDRFLTVTYGPSWRVPDPAFHFSTPRSTHRRFNGWFRGIRTQRALWDRTYASRPAPERHATDFARWVVAVQQRHGRPIEQVVDVGCGTGGDVLWFARRGVRATGLDFVRRGFESAAVLAGEQDLPARFLACNLLEVRSALSTAALIAVEPTPRVLTARHVVDSVPRRARLELWRVAAMMLADGGHLHLQFMTRSGDDNYARRLRLRSRRQAQVVRELEARGARVVERETVTYRRGRGRDTTKRPTRICRMVVTWER